MIASIIGHYLVDIGQITREQLHDLLKEHHKVRVKLGLIAVSEGLISWLMSFGNKIKVLEPQSIADAVQNRAKEILDAYK